MRYKEIVEIIKHLPWHRYRPEDIIYLSITTAYEFSKSLRTALKAYPNNENLKKIGEAKLVTTNLVYGEYNKAGDHDRFLAHFIGTEAFMRCISENVFWAREYYWVAVCKLSENNKRVPAMTTYSRVQELPGVLENILKSHDWEKLGRGFYKYYLERTIAFDVKIGGHAELKKDFKSEDNVLLEKFYEVLLDLYKSLEK